MTSQDFFIYILLFILFFFLINKIGDYFLLLFKSFGIVNYFKKRNLRKLYYR